jgi:hypothetical protein
MVEGQMTDRADRLQSQPVSVSMAFGAVRRITGPLMMQAPKEAGFLSKHLHFARPGFLLSLTR